jgi:hypothetical protein
VEYIPEAEDLISRLLNPDPELRYALFQNIPGFLS